MTDFEPYVADPAEPRPRPPLASLRPALWTLVLVILLVAATMLFLQGRGEVDPALTVPSPTGDPP